MQHRQCKRDVEIRQKVMFGSAKQQARPTDPAEASAGHGAAVPGSEESETRRVTDKFGSTSSGTTGVSSNPGHTNAIAQRLDCNLRW